MKNNPKGDYKPADIEKIARHLGFKLRQNGTSHAVLTRKDGEHLTIPMHKPIKAIYIKKLIEFID